MDAWRTEQINRIFNRPKNRITVEYIEHNAYLMYKVNEYYNLFTEVGLDTNLPQIVVSPILCKKCGAIVDDTSLFAEREDFDSMCAKCEFE